METNFKINSYVYSDVFITKDKGKPIPMVNFCVSLGNISEFSFTVDCPFSSLLEKLISLNTHEGKMEASDKQLILGGLEEIKKIVDAKIEEVKLIPSLEK